VVGKLIVAHRIEIEGDKLTEQNYKKLLKLAAAIYGRHEKILESVNLFEVSDIVHDFYLSSYYNQGNDWALTRQDFKRFFSDKIRNAKRRQKRAPSITNSQNMILSSFDENYRDEDLIEGYIYRNTRELGEARCI